MRRLADLVRFLDFGCDRSSGAILRRNNVEVCYKNFNTVFSLFSNTLAF